MPSADDFISQSQLLIDAIESEPTNPDHHLGLAVLCRDHSRHDEAEDHFQRALNFKPDHALALYEYGVLLVAQGELAIAMNTFGRAFDLDGGLGDAKLALAGVLYDLGKFKHSAMHYREYIGVFGV